MSAKNKHVYLFKEGNAKMKNLLGGKGANLAEMTRIGLPIPPGFTLTCELCNIYIKNKYKYPAGVDQQVKEALKQVEKQAGKKFGDPENPLLVSVRSGAPISMPGMMDTVLNLGLNEKTAKGMIKLTNNPRFVYDSYRRFIQMFGDVVMGVDSEKFEHAMEQVKKQVGATLDTELGVEELKQLVEEFKRIYKKETGKLFPEDPMQQLKHAIDAVFRSWNTKRAITYRKINKISDTLGTAVNVQTMAFGNMGEDSGTGVAFTRNPSTGENKYYGEYLMNAQGEDVVAGIRTPQPISHLAKQNPRVYKELTQVFKKLEDRYRDMQDIEFTMERGKLYILQTRTGKRTGAAAVRIAVEMVKEGRINKQEALLRVDPNALNQLLHRQISPHATLEVLAEGLPASPGAATGKAVFDADLAEEMGETGEKVILIRTETTPEDIHGIVAAQGILTSRGGMTSHAAVVARGMGKPCVAGCEAIKVDTRAKQFEVKGTLIKEGEYITVDGATGRVIKGQVPTVEPQLGNDFKTLLSWANQVKKIGVRTNADTPEDSQTARDFGAEGTGLCRTEHMFMAQERLPSVQEMIMAETEEDRRAALAKLLPMQRQDFVGIFRAMAALPVTIRLLDPPLHEFLPKARDLLVKITQMRATHGEKTTIASDEERLLKKVENLSELNPMLGHRGCRLGMTYPEIYEMQVRAIIEAAIIVSKEGKKVLPEIEIPLVSHANELKTMRQLVDETAKSVMKEKGKKIAYKTGTMIELPRACVTADQIAQVAEFFSFGTNDLTQTTFGFSRDDAEGKFLLPYVENKVLKENPFQVLDQEGVGSLMKTAIKLGRSVNKKLEVGICGEHGGEPQSVEFCHKIGLNYVSCSPFRVPIARLAAAQAQLKNPKKTK